MQGSRLGIRSQSKRTSTGHLGVIRASFIVASRKYGQLQQSNLAGRSLICFVMRPKAPKGEAGFFTDTGRTRIGMQPSWDG